MIRLLLALTLAGCSVQPLQSDVVRTSATTCAVVWIESGEGWLGFGDEHLGDPGTARQCVTIMRGQHARAWGDVKLGSRFALLTTGPTQSVCPLDCVQLGRPR